MNNSKKYSPLIGIAFVLMMVNPALLIIGAIGFVGYMVFKEMNKTANDDEKSEWGTAESTRKKEETTVFYGDQSYSEPEAMEPTVDYVVEEDEPWVDNWKSEDEKITEPVMEEFVEDLSIKDVSIEDLSVEVPEFDLTIPEIDTNIKINEPPVSEEKNDEKHVEGIRVICPMCSHENIITKVSQFETPNCEKCGMLLVNYNQQ